MKRKPSPNKRAHNYQTRYGISLDEYNAMWRKQGGLCFICGKPSTAVRAGKPVPLVVDHDHATGLVRKLLCLRCNVVLGFMGDCGEVLEAASRYLKLHASP